MIYEFRTYQLKPRSMGEVINVLATHFRAERNFPRLQLFGTPRLDHSIRSFTYGPTRVWHSAMRFGQQLLRVGFGHRSSANSSLICNRKF